MKNATHKKNQYPQCLSTHKRMNESINRELVDYKILYLHIYLKLSNIVIYRNMLTGLLKMTGVVKEEHEILLLNTV